tara:strand:- start:4583 stop:5155 length:573 start_codon:yes stop_codon:yes gene_type:complete
MSNTTKKRENVFKKSKLKRNNRWDKFQKTIDTNEEIKKPVHSRFDKFNNGNEIKEHSRFGERRSKFGERGSKFGDRRSKFGRKRIYKSKFNKEETMDYFSKEKNSTQRDASLMDFAKKLTNKKNKTQSDIKEDINKKIDITDKTELKKTTISQSEKDFILNQYMYEEETSEEEGEEETETETNNSGIIEF